MANENGQDAIIRALTTEAWVQAEELTRPALGADPRWAQGWVFLGEALEHQGQLGAAWACFDRAWMLDPRAGWVEAARTRLQPERMDRGNLPEWLRDLLAVPRVRVVGAMIARNESRTIWEAVTRLHEAVDKVVVVDTGSTDETPRLAQDAGAEVIVASWQDDFAAARNVAADALDGDWVLWVDADEMLDPDDVEVPRIIAGLYQGADKPALCRIVQVNHINGRVDPNYDTTRFFPTMGFEWRGRIHEQVVPINEGTLEVYRPAVRIRVHHDGYEPTIMQAKGKLARNIALLRRSLAENPQDVGVMGFLGRDLYVDNQLEAAVTVLTQAEQLAVRTPGYGRLPEVRHVLTEALMRLERWDEAESVVERLTRDAPDFPGGWFLAGQIHLAQAQRRLARANEAYRRAQETASSYRGTVSFHADIPTFLTVVGQADVARFQGRWRQAWDLYHKALAVYPDHSGIQRQLSGMVQESQEIQSNVSSTGAPREDLPLADTLRSK